MFTRQSWQEVVIRVFLIATILFSAPSNMYSVKAADGAVTPTETTTETPITLTETPTPPATPVATETPATTEVTAVADTDVSKPT